MRSRLLVVPIVLIWVAACSTANYQSPQFAERALHHEIIDCFGRHRNDRSVILIDSSRPLSF